MGFVIGISIYYIFVVDDVGVPHAFLVHNLNTEPESMYVNSEAFKLDFYKLIRIEIF